MSQRITISDIARELKLTTATVSRALNNHPRISNKTKQLVHDKAGLMKYRRNGLASSLRSGKSHTIGVIIPSARVNFFGSVVHGIQNMAGKNGYNLILFQSEETTKLEKSAIETFLGARVDGIIASIALETQDLTHFTELRKKNVPLVFFDRSNDQLDIPSVEVDDFKGSFVATKHLVDMGYKRIAHISGPQHLKICSERLRGYKAALKESNMRFNPGYIFQGDLSINTAQQAGGYFLNLPVPPDAVFAVEDFSALGLIKSLKNNGINIPKDFGVIGFANENFDEHITPALSSVDQQTVKMGEEAFNLLLQQIKKDNTDTVTTDKVDKVVLEPLLCIRESSKKDV